MRHVARSASPLSPARILVVGLAALALLVQSLVPAFAQQQRGPRLSFIRDAEIEQLMREYLDPLLAAAGLRKGFIRVVLVADRSFNAFVADGRRVFVNIGAIMESTTPNQIIGVLAHETGHIAGGHLARLRQELGNAQAIAIIGTLLGGAAVIGGARGGGGQVGSDSRGALGALTGGSELARRYLLAYQRTEEAAADRAALKFLAATGQSSRGMLETFERMANEQLFAATRMDRYLQSHPTAADRVAILRDTAPQSPHFNAKDPPARQARHDLARAKLYAFTSSPSEIARRYPVYDTSLAARYARAIIEYRAGQPDTAQRQIDALIQSQPGNPYFWELKGQALLEAGRPNEAIPPLRRAVALAPGQALIRTLLGHALVATDNPRFVDEAIKELANATGRDPENFEGFSYLAQAYGRKGDEGNAALAAARAALISGQNEEARRLARRAMGLLPAGTPGHRLATDIFEQKPERNT